MLAFLENSLRMRLTAAHLWWHYLEQTNLQSVSLQLASGRRALINMFFKMIYLKIRFKIELPAGQVFSIAFSVQLHARVVSKSIA